MKKKIRTILHKLHLYLGLASAIILIAVSLSGALMSYEKELLHLFNKDSYEVAPTQEGKIALSDLIEKFQAQKPDAKINALTVTSNTISSYEITIESEKSRKGETLYIDPYRATILPEISGAELFHTIENFHRRLLIGEVGKQIVGASVLILVFLLLSGIYIYLPKIKNGIVQALKVNKKLKGRAFLSSLHSSLGLWLAPIFLTISLTGLYWSYEWYREALYSITGVEKPQKKGKKPQISLQKNTTPPLFNHEIETIFENFSNVVEGEYHRAMLRIPRKKSDNYQIFYMQTNPAHAYARSSIELSSKDYSIVKHTPYDEKKLVEKMMGSMLALHSGEYFGWIGQLLFFLVALSMPLFGITGLMIYLKKTKKRK